jgi:hypothetical protein
VKTQKRLICGGGKCLTKKRGAILIDSLLHIVSGESISWQQTVNKSNAQQSVLFGRALRHFHGIFIFNVRGRKIKSTEKGQNSREFRTLDRFILPTYIFCYKNKLYSKYIVYTS